MEQGNHKLQKSNFLRPFGSKRPEVEQTSKEKDDD
jgi:hypothetical protein